MGFDFSISSDGPGNPAENRARRERTALQTMRAVTYDEAKRILESIATAGDAWEEQFSKALETARDGVFLTGKIEEDVGFLVASKIGKGIWFWRTGGTGCAKGLIPDDRVATLLELARRKGVA